MATAFSLIVVFVRRVAFDFSWLTTAYAAVRDRFVRKEEGQEVAERLERLRSQKEAIAGQIDERRAAARFEPQPDEAAAAGDLDRVLSEQGGATPRPAAPPPPSTGLAAGDAEQESYTSRLLKAKKEAWKDNPQ